MLQLTDPRTPININDRCPADLSIAVADYAGRSSENDPSASLGKKGGRKSNGKSPGEIAAIRYREKAAIARCARGFFDSRQKIRIRRMQMLAFHRGVVVFRTLTRFVPLFRRV